ncbi:hypothetical protein F66182_7449 [Fusarium sp. NRRL 66182]|nr:hypothetical protein F66182_7449 [Fusarium sp. NRRL 66182]
MADTTLLADLPNWEHPLQHKQPSSLDGYFATGGRPVRHQGESRAHFSLRCFIPVPKFIRNMPLIRAAVEEEVAKAPRSSAKSPQTASKTKTKSLSKGESKRRSFLRCLTTSKLELLMESIHCPECQREQKAKAQRKAAAAKA